MGDENTPYKDKLENIYKDDLFAPPTGRKVYQIISVCMAELFGSFFLMILGCASWLQVIPFFGIMVNPFPPLFEVALAWGFAYGGLYVCMAQISGYFLNPALTFTMVILGEMSIYRMFLYIICETVGAILGVLLLQQTVGDAVRSDFCVVKPAIGLPVANAFAYEFWGTFILALLFCVCHDARAKTTYDFASVKFAFGLVALNVALNKFSGCSLNPARSISAAIIANDFESIWVYIAGPLLGAIVAPILYLLVFNASIKDPGGEAETEAA